MRPFESSLYPRVSSLSGAQELGFGEKVDLYSSVQDEDVEVQEPS